MLSIIGEKIRQKTPIDRAEASYLYKNASLEQLSALASQAKSHHHTADTAQYLVMGIINYTNICVAGCDYCAFYKFPHEDGGYLLNFEELSERIDKLKRLGGTMVAFNGGFHPKLKLSHYSDLFAKIHKAYPELGFYEMTVAEFMFSCKLSKLSYAEGAEILKASGTQWITGGGAEILDDGFRKRHSPGKYTVSDYFDAQQAILDSGLGSTATMVIGFDETLEERLNHIEELRKFQDRMTSKLKSFLCWTYKPYNTKLSGEETSTEDYLRWLAVCRIYLQNFEHIRTSVLTKNEDALMGLKFGADDFDLPIEDEVTEKAGAKVSHDFDKVLGAAVKLGFSPKIREPFTVH